MARVPREPIPEKLPPWDREAEDAVVATALIDPDQIDLLASIIAPADFFREKNCWAWEAILALKGRHEGVNTITVAHELARVGRLEEMGGSVWLSELVGNLPSTVGAEWYAQIVRRDATYRQLIQAAYQIGQEAYAGGPEIGEVLGRSLTLIQAVVSRTLSKEAVSIQRMLEEWMALPGVPSRGVLTGWPALNEMLGPLRPGMVYIVAARPSKGKTTLAMQLAKDGVVEGGHKVLLVSLEMGRDAITARLLASASGIPSTRIENKQLRDDEERRVVGAVGELGDTELWVETHAKRLDEIEVRAKAHKLRHGLDLLIVDYLQLVMVRGAAKRYEMVTEASQRFKGLASDLEAAVVLVSQLSRSPEGRADHRPLLSDLRESGAIEQDADVVMFLHDNSNHVIEGPHAVDLLVDKNRVTGRVGKVALRLDPAVCQFTETGK